MKVFPLQPSPTNPFLPCYGSAATAPAGRSAVNQHLYSALTPDLQGIRFEARRPELTFNKISMSKWCPTKFEDPLLSAKSQGHFSTAMILTSLHQPHLSLTPTLAQPQPQDSTLPGSPP